VSQTLKLRPGQTLTITNTDVMSHELLRTAGATSFQMRLLAPGLLGTGTLKAPYAAGLRPHIGSVLPVTFPRAGVYGFTTKEGADSMTNVETVGADHVLKPTAIVA